jgi:hypothetical protein
MSGSDQYGNVTVDNSAVGHFDFGLFGAMFFFVDERQHGCSSFPDDTPYCHAHRTKKKAEKATGHSTRGNFFGSCSLSLSHTHAHAKVRMDEAMLTR